MKSLLSPGVPGPTTWYEIHFGRDVDEAGVTDFLRTLAADRRPHVTVLEVVSSGGVISFRIGLAGSVASETVKALEACVLGATCELISAQSIKAPTRGYLVAISTKGRELRDGSAEAVSRAVLGVMASTKPGEVIVLQWLLGPRVTPKAVPAKVTAPALSWSDVLKLATQGTSDLDHDARRALVSKVSEPGFRALGRVELGAASKQAEQVLAKRMLAALRVAEAPGITIRLKADKGLAAAHAAVPRSWPLTLNVSELTAVTGWPVGDAPYPGIDRSGPRRLRAVDGLTSPKRLSTCVTW